MKYPFLFFIFLISDQLIFCQTTISNYSENINKAESLYKDKKYKQAAIMYRQAFKSNNWNANPGDRIGAACAWASASVPDSAFFHLEKVATKDKFSDFEFISKTKILKPLHKYKKWQQLLETIKLNKEKTEAKWNRPLIAQLEKIDEEDQKYRLQIDSIEKKFGVNSNELKNLWELITKADTANLIQVTAILDKHGWLGSDVVGYTGNSTLFLVIQHADKATQQKYIPMLREAVKIGNAEPSDLALLEDRLALRNGKKQIYGSQLWRDPQTQVYYVAPLENPDNVDQRRASVGLPQLSDYLSRWKIDWNVQEYKKILPNLEVKYWKE